MNCMTYIYYCAVKNIGSKKTLVNLANHSNSPSSFVDFHYFHNIPFSICQSFSAKFPVVLIHQTFYCQNFPAKVFPIQYVTLMAKCM